MLENNACKRPYPSGKAQGFVTEYGEFVNRKDALTIAIDSKQVRKGETVRPNELFSEDLWRNKQS